MNYYIAFHLVNGREIRLPFHSNIDLMPRSTELVNELVSKPFLHFVDEGKLIVVNMNNVAYFRIFKIEEDV